MEQLIEYVDRHRTGISIVSGTGIFFSSFLMNVSIKFLFIVFVGWLFNKFWINRSLLRNDVSVRGKTVLITGGNAGIGYETAKELLRRGLIILFSHCSS